MRALIVEQKTVWGGGQAALVNVLREWQRQGAPIEPVVACPPGAALAARLRALDIPIVAWEPGAISKTRSSGWNALQRAAPTAALVRVIRQYHPQVVVANGAYAFLASVGAAKLARLATVWVEHNTSLPPGSILRRMLGAADRIVVVSRVIRAQFLALRPDAASKMSVIPNGVDTERFAPGLAAGAQRRAEWGWLAKPMVGTVSRLSPEKGVDDFIAACALVARERAEARFLVVGDGLERAALFAQARRAGLVGAVAAGEHDAADRLRFTGAREDIPALLNAMDVFVLASHTEALPLAVLEAMACGLPIVATDVGGVSEIVAHGETGLLVPPHAPARLAEQVLELVENKPAARDMGEKGRARVREGWTLARQAHAWAEALSQVAVI